MLAEIQVPIESQATEKDGQLMQELRSGNRDALSLLYKTHAAALYEYGYHLVHEKSLVEDAIHDVFVNLWNFRESLATVRSFRAYVFTSLRNTILRRLDRDKRSTHRDAEWLVVSNGTDVDSEANVISRVRQAINQLPDRQREVIFLRFYQGLSFHDIATMLEIDQQSAYNLASRAYSGLKQQLATVA